ncbi:MAG: TetR/AcrR family transcriptional regulator [Beijerinckiaceae bacterium]|nr:TetR/AcrR family transcriptional regulator [Beijerinckiaceae bacterium]
MARPTEFDRAVVLEAAALCFWEFGYEATSVRELASRMGIAGASLYNAFGDKQSLYREALNHYAETGFGDRVRRFEGNLPPRQALAAFFEEIVARSLNDAKRRGCLLVNSALDANAADLETQRTVAGKLVDIEAFFLRCVVAGQRAGDIACGQPAEDLARLLLGVLLGIRVLARVRPERPLLEGIVRPAFAVLDTRGDV